MDLPAFSAFKEDKPQAFYLGGQGDAEFAGLSDATIVANGVRLSVHSQILSQTSRVLRGLFAEKQVE